MKTMFMLVALISCFSAYATEDKYIYCEIEGMARANNSEFVSKIAERYLENQGLELDDICFQIKKASYDFVKNTIHSGNRLNTKDLLRFRKYLNFEEKVIDNVISTMNLK